MTLTLTDFFCGAGGSSTGAIQVPGVSAAMAANHWDLAVETHNTNHPETRHDCADLSQVDPRRYPTTDIGWFSPSCTNHSIAKGVRRADQQPDLFGEILLDAAAERSRATMWDVIRFAEHHRYRAIIVENVTDAREWVLWPAWSAALTTLDYEFRVVSLNSMHAQALGPGAPQSRDRLYVVAWRSGERSPDLDKWTRPEAECPQHGHVYVIQGWKGDRQVGRYRSQYVWRCPQVECRNTEVEPEVRPASDAIDWALPAVRIADRPRPLANKTMRRIREGFAAYARPLMVPAGGTWNDTAYPVTAPMRTRTTRETEGVAVPLMVPVEGHDGKQARPVDVPIRTCTARNETGVTVPPFIAELRGGGSSHRPMSAPLATATVTASGNYHGLAVPDMVAPYYGNAAPRPASEPLPTVTTVDRHALLRGGTVTDVEDLGFRMLSPDEYRAALEFPADYVLLGNKRERVRLAGNAVTPPAARDLIAAVCEAITSEDIPRLRTMEVAR